MTIDPTAPLFQALLVVLAALISVPPIWAAFVDGCAALILAHAQAGAIRQSAAIIAHARADAIRLGTRRPSRGS